MAGKIAALFGGKPRPEVNTNPAPGIGGRSIDRRQREIEQAQIDRQLAAVMG